MKWVLVYIIFFGPWPDRTGAESFVIEVDDLPACYELAERIQLATGSRAPNTRVSATCHPKGVM